MLSAPFAYFATTITLLVADVPGNVPLEPGLRLSIPFRAPFTDTLSSAISPARQVLDPTPLFPSCQWILRENKKEYFLRVHSFFILAKCVKMVAPAPIEAVMIPMIAAITVGFSNGLEVDVAVGWTVATSAGVVTSAWVVAESTCPPSGCRVPNTWVTWPGTTYVVPS